MRAVEVGSRGPVCMQEPGTPAAGWPSAPSHSPPRALLQCAQVSHYTRSGQFWNRSFGAARPQSLRCCQGVVSGAGRSPAASLLSHPRARPSRIQEEHSWTPGQGSAAGAQGRGRGPEGLEGLDRTPQRAGAGTPFSPGDLPVSRVSSRPE